MSGIFISYRREDTGDICNQLYRDLVAYFGQDRVFRDTSNMVSGRDFVDQIQQAIAQCNVLLVLIGPRYLDLTGPSGARRIDEPGDYVRQEIELARASGVEILPVVTQYARMPKAEDLPPSIAFLHTLDAAPLRSDADYPWHLQRLTQKVLALAPQLTPRFDAQATLARVQQGEAPAEWTVWRPSKGSKTCLVLTPGGVVQGDGKKVDAIDFSLVEHLDVISRTQTYKQGVYIGPIGILGSPIPGIKTQIVLPLVFRDGAMRDWTIWRAFRDHAKIAQAIKAAYNRFAQSHQGVGVPQPANYQAGAAAGGPSGAPVPMGSPMGGPVMTAVSTRSAQIVQGTEHPGAFGAGMRGGLITAGAIMLILVLLVASGFPAYQWQMYIYIALLAGSLSAGFLTVRQARALGASIVAGLALGISLWLFFASIVPALFPHFYGLFVNPGEVGFNVGIVCLVLAFVGGMVGKLTVRGQ